MGDVDLLIPLSALRTRFRVLMHRGSEVMCPCCDGEFRSFLPVGDRPNARCPKCGSRERHRALYLYLRDRVDVFGRALDVLHFAPERCLEAGLAAAERLNYVTADLQSPDVAIQTDITAIASPSARFDLVVCSHVLEHVGDDRTGLRELYRVLRPGGVAVIMVPYHPNRETYEDPTIVAPEARRQAFGQSNHLRLYGRDLPSRVQAAGFVARVDQFGKGLGEEARARYGVLSREVIFHCAKPAA